MDRRTSERLYREAVKLIPGGVNSPVRAFRSVNDTPFFVKRAKGASLFDVDGNEYIDYVASWGAVILGHGDRGIIDAVCEAMEEGTSFGACHPYEIELARLITEALPSVEMVRLTSSGTEATMSAIRLARGFTGKDGVIKFRGCYHGHVDSLLVKAGSGLATFGIPDSMGIPADLAKHTYVADFNHIDSVTRILDGGHDIACLIIEPIVGNMGILPPEPGFLEEVARLCREREILLIFDEVITGFRVGYGGAQGLYGVTPDLTCLGKIIGGGFPIGAYGGKREVMERIAPLGDVYQAGTLSGNPVAVRAGLYVLNYLRDRKEVYEGLKRRGEVLCDGITELAREFGIPYRINGVTGMFTGFFSAAKVYDYESALASDRAMYESFFKRMCSAGLFFAPSPFEAAFVTLSHREREIEFTLNAFREVFRALAAGPG